MPQILLEEVSNFAPPMIEKMIKESLNKVNLAKVSSQPQSTYEAAATLTEFELTKILIDKMNKSESFLTAPEHRESEKTRIKMKALLLDDTEGLRRTRQAKTKNVQSEVPEFEVADTNMPQDQGGNLSNDDDEPKKESASKYDWHTFNYAELEYDFEECYKAFLDKLDWDNPDGEDYPFDLTVPLVKVRNRQKAAHYDLPAIEDMVPSIWSPVKVALDIYAKWGIFHWRDQ
nr:hypothetical protein [Tanacetum cinerariifolium]